VSHPCGEDTVVTTIGSVAVAAGRVTVTFPGAGRAVLLTWYVNVSDAGLTVGPDDWAAATAAQTIGRSRRFIPHESAENGADFRGMSPVNRDLPVGRRQLHRRRGNRLE
jgi:hypothetical protein